MSENKSKFDIVSKMTLIGIIAVSIIILAIVIVSCSGGSDKPKTESPDEGIIITDPEKVDETVVSTEKVYERALAVVKYVDVDSSQLMIYDIEKLKTVTLAMDSAVEIKDEYGTDIALSQVELGDMVETKYDVNSLKPENVKITAVIWQRKDVSNMVVDTENKTIRIANEKYSYTDELITSDNGVPFDILELSTADEAIVKGYKDHVWSIVLVNGHGTLTLINHESFVGGNIEISSRINHLIESATSVPISAGVHNVVILKDGMAPYVTQVMIEEGKEVTLDLSEVQPKVGIIEFILLQDDVTVFMDDEEVDLSEEIKLDFGTYMIRAEKEGFTPWESELDLSQAYIQFKIDLEKTPTNLFIQEPAGAEVYLDGLYVGIVPTKTPFLPGTHKITLRQDGFYTFQQDFYWDDNGQDQYILLPALTPITQEEAEEETPETPTEDIYSQPEIPAE